MVLVSSFVWHGKHWQKGFAKYGKEHQWACSSCVHQLEFENIPAKSLYNYGTALSTILKVCAQIVFWSQLHYLLPSII